MNIHRAERSRAGQGAQMPVLVPGGIEWTAPGSLPPAAADGRRRLLVPAEHVLLRPLHLPIAARQQRLAAAPFAIEDDLAEPVTNVHVALGPELAPQTHLAGAVRVPLLAEWIATAQRHGLGRLPIVPDALLLPVPTEGTWSIWSANGRTLARMADGGGFGVPSAGFATAWRAGGSPKLLTVRGGLPPGVPADAAAASELEAPAADPAGGFDLRAGFGAAEGGRSRRALVAIPLILLAGAVLHLAILAADAWRLGEMVEDRRREAAAMLADLTPGQPTVPDPAAALLRLLPRQGSGETGQFLPMLSRFSEAVIGHGEGLSVPRLAYSAADRTLALSIVASDLAALQEIEAALDAGGLAPVAGAASVSAGGAEVRMVLQYSGGTR